MNMWWMQGSIASKLRLATAITKIIVIFSYYNTYVILSVIDCFDSFTAKQNSHNGNIVITFLLPELVLSRVDCGTGLAVTVLSYVVSCIRIRGILRMS